MRIIKHLVEQITEELEDAEKYAECAMKHKADDPELAEAYYWLAGQELEHMHALHDQVTRIINEIRDDPPPVMQVIWDWEHEKMIKWEREIRLLMDMFRQ